MDIIHQTESSSEMWTKVAESWAKKQNPSFDELSASVLQTHQMAQSGAIRAINQMATLRNWLIGCYIVEYEQNGSDRAKYGDRLLKRLEESVNTKGLNVTLFQISRLFYNYYPQIGDIIYATVSHKLPQEQIYATPSHKFMTPGKVLLGKLSFSHIREIMTQDDPLARFFYETECIKGTWSVKERRLEDNRRKEQERQARLKAEREQAESLQPFTFKSNCHQRYENGTPVQGLQECLRTVSVVRNTNGCPGYRLQPGIGYIVKIYNDDLGKPNMSDKPMKVVRKTETSVELRGYPIEAQTPFGWQEVDYSDYGLNIHYEHGKFSKCVLHMYDRNTFIEYRVKNTQPLNKAEVNNTSTNECEQYAQMAKKAAEDGNTSMAQQYGFKVYQSIISNPSQIDKIKDSEKVALALGKLMEGEFFTDNDSILKAVGLTYYFLCKAIKTTSEKDPYLYVYRFSTIWEYNKVFYHLFAHAEGTNYNPNPFDVFGQSSTAVYDHHMQGMQMADVLTEPRVRRLDPALGNIFNQMYARYSSTPSQQIISLGNKYHDQVYSYLKQKVESKDFNF